MLGERLGIEPHETCCTHVLEEGHLVVIGHVFPLGVVLAVLAMEMGEVAPAFVAAEIQADADSVLEGTLVGHGFSERNSLFDVEEAHLQVLVVELLAWLFLAAFLLFAIRLALAVGISFGWLMSGGVDRRLFGNRRSLNEPSPSGVGKETSREGWDVLGKGIVVDVFLYF